MRDWASGRGWLHIFLRWRKDELLWYSLALLRDRVRSLLMNTALLKSFESPVTNIVVRLHHKYVSSRDSCAEVPWMKNLFLISSGPGLRSQAWSLACRLVPTRGFWVIAIVGISLFFWLFDLFDFLNFLQLRSCCKTNSFLRHWQHIFERISAAVAGRF